MLVAEGIVPGNRVLLRGPNEPWLAACWLGVLLAGGVAVATMPMLRATELTAIAELAKPALALCHHAFTCVFDPRQVRAALPISLDDYLAHDHVLVSQRGDLQGVVDEALRRMGQARHVAASTSRFSVVPSWLSRSPLIATMANDIALELSLNHELACSPLPFDVPGYEVHMCWHRRDDNNPSAAWFRDLVRRVGGEDAQRARVDAAS